jgi:hypothetical protein
LQAYWSVAIAKATVIIFLGAILLADVMFLEESSFVFDPDYKVSPAALPPTARARRDDAGLARKCGPVHSAASYGW